MLINNHSNTIKNLNEHDKAVISRLGIRIGAKYFFMPNLLKKFPMELSALLWQVFDRAFTDAKWFPYQINLIDMLGQGAHHQSGDDILLFHVRAGAGPGRDASHISAGHGVNDNAQIGLMPGRHLVSGFYG